MKPSFMRLTGTSLPALNAARKSGVTLNPHPGLAVEPQLNGPASFAAGESNASVVPKLTPSAPNPARPTVRTEKSAWLRYISTRIGGGGVYAYFFENVAYACSA